MADDETADSIILKYSLLAGAADLTPLVGADLAGILACQLKMYYELAEHYQVAVTKERFKDLALTLAGAVGGWGVTFFGATKMLKMVPGRAETISKGVWYPHEEEWQSYVKWRDADGLRAFDVEYKYVNDYGVNAEAVAEVSKYVAMAKIGLKSAHATFKETVWHLEVQFADVG